MATTKKENPEINVEAKLKNLYKLQTMLSEIDKIKTIRGELPLEVQDLEDEIEGLTTRIDKIQEEIAGVKQEIAKRKATIANNESGIARYTEQLNNVRNNREYENLTKEIEYFQLDNTLHEKKIHEAEEYIERRQEEIRRCSDTVTEHRLTLEMKRSELEEIVGETRLEEEKLREESKELETCIDPRLLTAFKRIRKNCRNGLAVVYVHHGACGGCFNKIPPQRQLDIRLRKKIIVCEYCGRIMIDSELAGIAPEQPAEPEKKTTRKRTSSKKAAETEEEN